MVPHCAEKESRTVRRRSPALCGEGVPHCSERRKITLPGFHTMWFLVWLSAFSFQLSMWFLVWLSVFSFQCGPCSKQSPEYGSNPGSFADDWIYLVVSIQLSIRSLWSSAIFTFQNQTIDDVWFHFHIQIHHAHFNSVRSADLSALHCACSMDLFRGRFQTILGKINVIVTLTFDPPPLNVTGN